MAQGPCDGCGERPVMFMVTQVDTGQTNGWCPFCFLTSAESFGQLLIEQGVIEAPPEAEPKSRRSKRESVGDDAESSHPTARAAASASEPTDSPAEAEATEPAAALDG